MAFVNVVGLGNSLARRRAVARFRIPLHRRRGVGDTAADCGDGYVLDTRTNPPHCILSRFASLIPQVAMDYPQAPGCHVVDLSRNACQYADGSEGGCNSMPECDPLTGALHYQYGLPGGPTNTAITALKTGVMTPSPFTMAPNPNLKNPTGGSVFIPATQNAVQAAIAAALGKDSTATFKAAVTNAPPATAGSGGGSAGGGSTGSGGSGGGAPAGDGGAPSASPFDFLTNPVSIFGFSVPTWGVFAAVGVGIFAFAGKHR